MPSSTSTVLSPANFDPLPDKPLRTARFWLGNALSFPLWCALGVLYLLTRRE